MYPLLFRNSFGEKTCRTQLNKVHLRCFSTVWYDSARFSWLGLLFHCSLVPLQSWWDYSYHESAISFFKFFFFQASRLKKNCANKCLSQYSMKQYVRLAEQLSLCCLLVYVRTSVERDLRRGSSCLLWLVSEDLLARAVMQIRCSYIIVWCTGRAGRE